MINKPLPPPVFVQGPFGRLATLSQKRSSPTNSPGLLWLGGYASDMRGTKAQAIDAYAQMRDISYTRFDYSGHGESDGDFEDGTISRWTEDAATILQGLEGQHILIGSSMGGWIAGLLARRFPEKLAGLVLIAPAPDFATELTPTQWPPAQWEKLQQDGQVEVPSAYDDSVMVYTKAMFDDGAQQRILDRPLPVNCPVKILTGMKDDVVPWTHAVRYGEHMQQPDVDIILVKEGDHRMSGPKEISLLLSAIDDLTAAQRDS
ncbi:MAG: alpha/beta hydrolase [Pseudomonadota bacterium]